MGRVGTLLWNLVHFQFVHLQKAWPEHTLETVEGPPLQPPALLMGKKQTKLQKEEKLAGTAKKEK